MNVLMKPGDIVADKYRLKERLGIGGMGQVWSVTHTQTDREFAIKVMHPHIAESQEARSRFTREAKASARINHPNVIDIFDVGEMPSGSLYLVMELLDGLPLADAFFAHPPLSVRDFLSIMLDSAHALEAAHQVGVVHRDVKPANIYLHRERVSGLACAKIVDFGISKFSAANDSVATNTGSVLGSPRYMSPEQTRSAASTDARSDIWALGVVLFEGLCGFWPHDGDSYSSLVLAIVTNPPKSIDEHAPHLPEELRDLIRSCLQPLETRLQSASEVAKRLTSIIEDGNLATLSLPEPQTKAGGVTTTGPISVKTPPPRKGLGAEAKADVGVSKPDISISRPDDDEKTEMHLQLPPPPIDDEISDDEDGPTGRVDPNDVRSSNPDLERARAGFQNMLGTGPAAVGEAWKPAPSPKPAAGQPPPAGGTNVDTLNLASPVASSPQAAAPPPAPPEAPAPPPGQLGRGTVRMRAEHEPAPLTETESKMNMAASQAPPPPAYTPNLQGGTQKKPGGTLGLAAAVMAIVGIGVGWLVVSIASDDETTATAADSVPTVPTDAPPPEELVEDAPSDPAVATAAPGGETEGSEEVPEPTDTASAAASADAPPPAPSAEASAKPPSKPGRPSGRPPPPPKPGIDDLGSGL